MEMRKKHWIQIDISKERGDPEGDWHGIPLITQQIPINKKFHCEICEKKPHIYVADDKEGVRVLLFCTWVHLHKFFRDD